MSIMVEGKVLDSADGKPSGIVLLSQFTPAFIDL